MVSIEDTIDVPAETYSHALPDDYSGESIEIGITAFGDKLYLKFPRFDRRGTNDFCMSASTIFHATVKVDDRRELEVQPCLRRMNVLREHEEDSVVTGDPDDVWTTTLGDKSDAEPAHLKLVEEFATTIAGHADSETQRDSGRSDSESTHFQDDDYWAGYKRAANKFGDERYQWPDVAWDCFSDRWDGNKELLLDVGKWFARDGIAVCSKAKAFFPVPQWTTPTGSYVATISDVYQGTCPFCGADKDEHWECIKSPASVRKPNVYKCNACGETKRGITTG